MASARELLAQADALMRRNRVGAADAEIPELTDIVAMVAAAPGGTSAQAPSAAPAVLDDVPELTEAVEEIEIESIVELPEDLDESSGWLHHDHGELSIVGRGPDSVAASIAVRTKSAQAGSERPRSALAPVAKHAEAAAAPSDAPPAESLPQHVVPVAEALRPKSAPVAEPPSPARATAPDVAPASAGSALPGTTDEWARWEALADEIRMQVLQRIDVFTDTRLRDQLSAQLQPIVDRASAEMVATINAHVGSLLRAYIAEAVEREVEKLRGPPR